MIIRQPLKAMEIQPVHSKGDRSWVFFGRNDEKAETPDIQAGFRKGRGTRDQIASIHWIIKKQESSRKTSTFALLTTPKPLTVWVTTNCGKFLKRWEHQTT